MVDVSRNTVLILLVLTVVVSVIGTYSLLVSVDDVMKDRLSNPSASSQVSISIKESQDISGAVVKDEADGSSYARFGLSKRGA